jgi:hypothetical protein
MSLICPAPSPITALVAQTCPEIFDQIQAVAFQEAGNDTAFLDLAAIQLLSNWTTLIAAVDATKIQVAQVVNPVIAASEALTVGGNDNTTIDGIPEYNGEGFTALTWEFRNLNAVNKRALLDYRAHSVASIGSTNLTCIFFAKGNKIIYNGTTADDKFTGFPVFNFRISSVSSAGLNAQNIYQAGVSVGEGWDDYFATTQAGFNISDVLT